MVHMSDLTFLIIMFMTPPFYLLRLGTDTRLICAHYECTTARVTYSQNWEFLTPGVLAENPAAHKVPKNLDNKC